MIFKFKTPIDNPQTPWYTICLAKQPQKRRIPVVPMTFVEQDKLLALAEEVRLLLPAKDNDINVLLKRGEMFQVVSGCWLNSAYAAVERKYTGTWSFGSLNPDSINAYELMMIEAMLKRKGFIKTKGGKDTLEIAAFNQLLEEYN